MSDIIVKKVLCTGCSAPGPEYSVISDDGLVYQVLCHKCRIMESYIYGTRELKENPEPNSP
jgi:RNase P subunit RPR2